MSSLSNYLEEKLLKHVLGIESFSSPAKIYLGLSSTVPLEDGSNWTEISGGGYQRQPLAFNGAEKKDSSPFGAKIASATAAHFGPGPSPSGWSYMTLAYGLFDAASGGNLLAFCSSMGGLSVAAGKYAYLAPGGLQIDLDCDACWTTYSLKSLLDRSFANGSFSSPSVYVALSTSSALSVTQEEATGINELSGGNYSRKQITAGNWGSVAQVSDKAQVSNDENVDFAQATADWSAIQGGGLATASSGGKMLLVGVLADSVFNGDILRIAVNGAYGTIG